MASLDLPPAMGHEQALNLGGPVHAALLSMGAALAVAAPAVLVLLAFGGKPRRSLVAKGRRATANIARLALCVLLYEGNAVAAVCAATSFAAVLFGWRTVSLHGARSFSAWVRKLRRWASEMGALHAKHRTGR